MALGLRLWLHGRALAQHAGGPGYCKRKEKRKKERKQPCIGQLIGKLLTAAQYLGASPPFHSCFGFPLCTLEIFCRNVLELFLFRTHRVLPAYLSVSFLSEGQGGSWPRSPAPGRKPIFLSQGEATSLSPGTHTCSLLLLTQWDQASGRSCGNGLQGGFQDPQGAPCCTCYFWKVQIQRDKEPADVTKRLYAGFFPKTVY